MRRWTPSLLALSMVLFCAPAFGQGWVRFFNETATRIDTTQDPNSGPTVIVNNPDEKDYAWDDVDNDGDVDLVGVYKQLGTTTGKRRNVLLMNQGGVLTDRTTAFISNETGTIGVVGSQGFLDLTNDRDVIIADVNNDGWKDIVTAVTLSGGAGGTPGNKMISHPRIYINRGDDPPSSGNWLGFIFDDLNRVPTMAAEPRFCAVSAGDIDGDSDLDLLFGDYEQGGARPVDLNNRLWINNGAGYFTDQSEARMTFVEREVSFCMATDIVDMNGDGAIDLIVDDALNAPTSISIVYNDPANLGFFDDMIRDHVYTLAPYHVDVGNLNNDTLPDFIATDDGNDRFALNTGNGADGLANFSSFVLVGSSSGEFGGTNHIADLNKDGFNDVLITSVDVDLPSCNTHSKIFRNFGLQPNGFNVTIQESGTAGISLAHLQGGHDIAIFDINGDTWLDLVIGRCSGTTVYVNQPPVEGLLFSYPSGLPVLLTEGQPFSFQVAVDAPGGVNQPTPGSGVMHLQTAPGGPFTPIPMVEGSPDVYTAELPAGSCPDHFAFFFTADMNGDTFTDPADGAVAPFVATVAEGSALTVDEHFEADVSGWTIVDDPTLTTGSWEQAEPLVTVNAGFTAAPGADAEATIDSTKAFVTENCPAPGCGAFAHDIDGGGTELISPLIDLDGTDAVISYFRWFYTSAPPGIDTLKAWVANDGDQPSPTWVLVESVNGTSNGSDTAWQGTSFLVSDFVAPSANVRVRFRAEDVGTGSTVEAGVDLFQVDAFVCSAVVPCACLGDLSENGLPNGGDIRGFVDCFMGGGGNCGCADVDPTPGLDDADIEAFVDTILTGAACE